MACSCCCCPLLGDGHSEVGGNRTLCQRCVKLGSGSSLEFHPEQLLCARWCFVVHVLPLQAGDSGFEGLVMMEHGHHLPILSWWLKKKFSSSASVELWLMVMLVPVSWFRIWCIPCYACRLSWLSKWPSVLISCSVFAFLRPLLGSALAAPCCSGSLDLKALLQALSRSWTFLVKAFPQKDIACMGTYVALKSGSQSEECCSPHFGNHHSKTCIYRLLMHLSGCASCRRH